MAQWHPEARIFATVKQGIRRTAMPAWPTQMRDDEVWDMATVFSLQNIIKPQETRDYLVRMFDVYRSKRGGGIGKHLLQNWPTSY